MWMAKLLLLESTEIQMTGSQIRMTDYNASGTTILLLDTGWVGRLGAASNVMENSRYNGTHPTNGTRSIIYRENQRNGYNPMPNNNNNNRILLPKVCQLVRVCPRPSEWGSHISSSSNKQQQQQQQHQQL
jgi:hypothetical protein